MKHALWIALVALLAPRPARAWLLHEHTATAAHAVATMVHTDHSMLEAAWKQAAKMSRRLCAEGPGATGEKLYRENGEFCVGFPVLTGLSADHSCSPWETLSSLDESFVRNVLFEAEQVEVSIRRAEASRSNDLHVGLWHLHHLNLQVVDADYLSRAEQNAAHFQLAREANDGHFAYVSRILKGRSSNAIGLYVNYHLAALGLAAKAAAACPLKDGEFRCPPAGERNGDATFARALATEAFAIHFLQDAFSAGHFQSVDGTRSERMGTHDHYCKEGVLAEPWQGGEYVAHGDAFLEVSDTERVAVAIDASLAMFAKALRGETLPAAVVNANPDLDACKSPMLPEGLAQELAGSELLQVLSTVPRPVANPPGLPRFSQELGVFYAPFFATGGRFGFEAKNPDDSQPGRWPVFGYIGMALGGTFEGIADGSTDGVVALGPAVGVDVHPPGSGAGVGVVYGGVFHIPYWLVPGDLIPLALTVGVVDLITGGDLYFRMARRAASGGVLGLQGKHPLFWNSRLQFVLGREGFIAGMSTYGKPNETEYYLKFGIPVFNLTTFHANGQTKEGAIGLDQNIQLGYDVTYRKARGWDASDNGQWYQGIYLSYGLRARRYVYQP